LAVPISNFARCQRLQDRHVRCRVGHYAVMPPVTVPNGDARRQRRPRVSRDATRRIMMRLPGVGAGCQDAAGEPRCSLVSRSKAHVTTRRLTRLKLVTEGSPASSKLALTHASPSPPIVPGALWWAGPPCPRPRAPGCARKLSGVDNRRRFVRGHGTLGRGWSSRPARAGLSTMSTVDRAACGPQPRARGGCP